MQHNGVVLLSDTAKNRSKATELDLYQFNLGRCPLGSIVESEISFHVSWLSATYGRSSGVAYVGLKLSRR